MKRYNQAKKYGKVIASVVAMASSSMALAVADAELVAAATTALTDGADTSKAIYVLWGVALAVIIAVSWGISALRSSRRG